MGTGKVSEVSFENALALAVAKEMSKWLKAQDTRTNVMLSESIRPLYELISKFMGPMMEASTPPIQPQTPSVPPPQVPPVGSGGHSNAAELVVYRDADGYQVNVLYSNMSMKEIFGALKTWLGDN